MAALERLTKRREYLRAAGRGRKWVTPGLVLQGLPRCTDTGERPLGDESADAEPGAQSQDDSQEPKPPIRLGITVSRKVGNAVQRNRARRRLRAAAKEVLPQAGRAGFDYVVIGRQGTLLRPYGDLLADLRKAVGKVNDPKRGSEGSDGRRDGSSARRKPAARQKTGRPAQNGHSRA